MNDTILFESNAYTVAIGKKIAQAKAEGDSLMAGWLMDDMDEAVFLVNLLEGCLELEAS